MLYTCQNPIVELQTVGRFAWNARNLQVSGRPFSALAIRVQGGGSMECNGKTYSLRQGDVLYMPQNLSYSYQYTDTELLLFHFITAKSDTEPEIFRPQHPEELIALFQKAVGCWEQRKPGYMGRCISLLYRILGKLAENEATVHLPREFTLATSYLQEHFQDRQLRIGQACYAAGISQTTFRQLFQKHFGCSPVEHLTELRLEHARGLIAAGVKVEEAALESGFGDSKYFSRVVKRQLGCTPRQLKTD